MDEQIKELQGRLVAMAEQRNQAMDTSVVLLGKLGIAGEKIKALEEEIKKLKEEKSPKKESKK